VKRILADNDLPRPLVVFLGTGYLVTESRARGWAQIKNGILLQEAEAAGFDLLLTADQDMRFQQNLTGRKIAVVVLSSEKWPRIKAYIERVISAIDAVMPGSVTEVEIPWSRK
jgi:hypothetical protein